MQKKKKHQTYLEDIFDAITRIEIYTKGLTWYDFKKDILIQDAVIRNFQVIGEAVKKLPEEIKTLNPDIEWRKIAGIRDVLVHDYASIDLFIVWDVIENKIEKLKKEIKVLLDTLNN